MQSWAWERGVKKAPGVIFREDVDRGEVERQAEPPAARRMALKQADFTPTDILRDVLDASMISGMGKGGPVKAKMRHADAE